MIIVTSTFTADVMRHQLEYLLKKFAKQKIAFIYNQIFQQMLLPTSESNTNNDGLNIFLIRLYDLFNVQHSNSQTSAKMDDLLNAIQSMRTHMQVPMLVIITPTECFQSSETNFFISLEKKLQTSISSYKNIFLIPSEQVLEQHQSNLLFDNFSEKYGHIPYTPHFYNSVATIVARKYFLLIRKPSKVIVLDCDGTLWDGIIEEDGIESINIDNDYSAIHTFIIECYKNGFLICLCSKNSEASVLSVFKHHKNMQLNLEEHICTYRINWEAKSVNIKSIAQELDLGLDSFIFIDDNKIECAEVKARIPEALVIELPKNKKDRLTYLQNIWAFDSNANGTEDKNRTKFYQKNKLRLQSKEESFSYSQFLKNLEIQTLIEKAEPKDYERIFQLSQRTNQFNIFPNSMTGIEFDKSINTGEPSCLVINVSDKFGDYGLVGVLVYELQKTRLKINALFLSCRILGRGIEYDIFAHLSHVAKEHHIEQIEISFVITDRNIPAINFLKKISGEQNLSTKNQILLPIKQITPTIFLPSETDDVEKKPTPAKTTRKLPSNDFMLEIAAKAISSDKPAVALVKSSHSIKANLLEILMRHKICISKKNTTFLNLGMDSLRSVLIASDIYRTYHITINPFDLLDKDFTFNTLLKYLFKEIATIKNNFIPGSDDIINYPLSQAQKRLWYDEKIDLYTNRNNMFVAYEITGHLNVDILEKAFLALIARHEVFRFSFFEINDEPFIKIDSLSEIKFRIDRLRDPGDISQEQFIEDFKYKNFDLSHAPLIRVGVITNPQNKHIVLLGIHHIIHDGWSLGIILDELSILYEAISKKISLPITEAAPSYIEFISWENKYISPKILSKQRRFWKNYLHKLPKLELLYDQSRHDVDEKAFSKRVNFKLDAATTKKLIIVAKNNNVTLYELLISAFTLILAHYSNQNDISFITAFSGRHNALASKTVGFFVNLILLRFQLNPTDTFSEILQANKKNLSEILKHQDLPFSDILQITGETVSSKIHTFTQAGFIFQNYPSPKLVINGKHSERILADDLAELLYDACQECRFGNLVCFMQEFESNLHGLFEYNSQLFHKDTIHHIITAFRTLLKNIASQPTCPAISMEIVSKQQKKVLLNKWSRPSKKNVYKQSVISCFLEQVAKHPHKIAIKHNHSTISYTELDKQSNHLAHALKNSGVKFEKPVGIFLEKTIDYVIAIIAVLKASGCYVPIEIEQPATRIKYIIDDIALAHIITNDEGAPHLKKVSNTSITIVDMSHKNIPTKCTPHYIDKNGSQLAYILYTSGSTGNPKGVMIEQEGILRLVHSPNYIKIQSKDRIAQSSSINFDAATFEIWGALLNGATLVLLDKRTLLDPQSFAHFLEREKISILFLTTQLFHSYSFSMPTLFKNLKYMVVGGEAVLSDSVSNIFQQDDPPHCFINGYGPTENTTFSTTYSIKNLKNIPDPIPIGKPITETEVYVLGKHLNFMPVGSPGQLYLGGPGLARQYVNLKSLNQTKFIHHLGKKLYCTGDVVAWQADGNLRYLGREDNQVKLNGYRIELDEVEAQIKIHPLVEQAVVVIKELDRHKQLVAYVLLKDTHALSEVNLHHHLKLFLPKYMLPTSYYQITHIPITNTGKVDKKALMHQNLPNISYIEYESPSSPLQENLIHIYSKTLKMDPQKIGINAEFFDLGGNSISALTLIHMINDTFHIKLNFSELYESSSVKLLSEKINHMINESHLSSITRQKKWNRNSLKKIKNGDFNKTPLVFIHPIGGTGFCYLDLIKLLPNDQPCYIIQDPSIDADQILFDDIVSMATHYIDLLLNHSEIPRFILAGYSFGGMLALEMIHQLEQKKLEKVVVALIAFDTWIVSNLLDVAAKQALKNSIMQQYKRIEDNLSYESIDPKPWMELYYYRLQELGFTYAPPRISKRIILFKAAQQTGEFSAMNDSTNYLGLHTTEYVDTYLIPGNHDSILQQPNVKHISLILNNLSELLEKRPPIEDY